MRKTYTEYADLGMKVVGYTIFAVLALPLFAVMIICVSPFAVIGWCANKVDEKLKQIESIADE